MGVRGLLKFLREHPEARKKNVSLATIAEKKRQESGQKTVIVCDFLSILFWLLGCFHDAKVLDGSYKSESYVYGGDYIEYGNRFISFIRALRYVCAEPILFVDSARGSILKEFNAKLQTYKARSCERLNFVEKCVSFCKYAGKQVPEDIKKWKTYPMIIPHVLMALRSEGVQIVYCNGEADSEMAIYARTHSARVCGIMTTDTDMVMMRKCTVIHCKFFDRENVLGIKKSTFNEKPDDIVCDLISPQSIARALKIPTENLKIISIICGNDYTHAYRLSREMKLAYPFIVNSAKWLLKNPKVSKQLLAIPIFKRQLEKTPEFFDAVKHTYEAYGEIEAFKEMCAVSGLTFEQSPVLVPNPKSPHMAMVLAEVKAGRMIRLMSSTARNGIIWRTQYVEGIDPGDKKSNRIQDLVVPLREVIYQLLGLAQVREHGHFTDPSNAHQDYVLVHHSALVLPKIRQMSELCKVLHLLPMVANARKLHGSDLGLLQCATVPDGYSPNLAAQFKPLLLFVSLLYAHSLKEESSTFHDGELATNVFLATCLMSVYENPPFNVLERPTVDAVNMNTGFACIIHLAYQIASLLGLFHLLPPPGYLYQPAALVVFHHVATASEDTVKSKSKVNRDFIKIHTTYTFIVQLRRFAVLKDLLQEFQQKCSTSLVTPAEMARLAIAFYHVLGEFHSKVPDLEAHIEELQGATITTQSVSSKGKGKASKKKKATPLVMAIDKKGASKKKKKTKSHGAKPFMEDLATLEADLTQLEALSTQDRAQTGIEQLSIVEPTPEST